MPTGMMTRRLEFDSVQLMRLPVTKSRFGTISSLLFQSRIVVARVRIRVTVPVMSLIVTVSPTRMGRSNSRMMPETKFAKIS